MSVDVIVGGQGGDEGKGKIAAYLSLKRGYDVCMRVSGPNAGHSIMYKDKKVGLATISCGFINEKTRILVGRGAFILVDRLLEELEKTELTNSGRFGIDDYATVISEEQFKEEIANNNLKVKIGSVGTGLGPARRDKIMRDKKKVKFAKEVPELKKYLTDSVAEIAEIAESKEKKILLEGDQGFKLSLIHGEYPFVTSRDTTASTFLAQAGVNPRTVRDVYIVFKPYVTRVGPGPLEKEIQNPSEWYHNEGGEFGTVSGRKRRIGAFEWENAQRAIWINGATKIALTHMDVFSKKDLFPLSTKDFLQEVRDRLCIVYPYPKIALSSHGPQIEDIVELEK